MNMHGNSTGSIFRFFRLAAKSEMYLMHIRLKMYQKGKILIVVLYNLF